MLQLAFLIELTWLLVDSVSGLFQHNGMSFLGGQNISALYRAAALVVFVGVLLQHTRLAVNGLVVALPLALLWPAIQATYWNMDTRDAIGNAQFMIKCIMPMLMYMVLQIQLQLGALDLRRVRWIVAVNALVLLGNIALPLLGLGFGQYGISASGELIGGKGFFYAGNEVAAVAVCLFSLLILMFHPWLERHALRLAILTLGFLLAAVSTASKTSVLGICLLSGYALVFLGRGRSALQALIIGVVMAALSSPWWMPLLERMTDRWEYFLDVSDDLLSFATSGRTDRLGDFVAWIEHGASGAEVLLGRGYLGEESELSIEIDPFDLIYCYGLLGVVPFVVLSAWAMSAFNRPTPSGRHPLASFAGWSLLLLLAIAMSAGHVMYSAMLAPFLALLALSPTLVQTGSSADRRNGH